MASEDRQGLESPKLEEARGTLPGGLGRVRLRSPESYSGL